MVHEILGVHVDDLDDRELRIRIEAFFRDDRPRVIVTPNPEMLLLARRDVEFRTRLNRADLRLPDGVGVQFGVRILTGKQLVHRHTGVDTLEMIVDSCAHGGKKLLLLGGQSGEGEEAARRFQARYPDLHVTAIDPGTISHPARLDDQTMDRISAVRPDVIAVALGQKKQEAVMEQIRERIPSVRILIGIGGAFNMISGRLRRAPVWMRKCGLEWLWRVLIEPSRFPRTFRATVVFPITVIWTKLKH